MQNFSDQILRTLKVFSTDGPKLRWHMLFDSIFYKILVRNILCCSLPVPLSLADTFTMPLASMSKVTSIWGTPLGAGGIPTC